MFVDVPHLHHVRVVYLIIYAILYHVITLEIAGTESKLMKLLLCNFLQSYVTSYFLGSDILCKNKGNAVPVTGCGGP
jgi:hypothetical protein